MASPAGTLTRNWPLKLAALGLAMLLWTAVRIGAVSRQEIPEVPVQVQLTDPAWQVLSDPAPAAVAVTFSGPARHLFGVALDQPTVVVPIDQVTGRDTTIVLRSDWVQRQNQQVVVEEIQPSTVRLTFERFAQEEIPLRHQTRGALPDSLALARDITVRPLFATVRGPESAVDRLEVAFLQPLDLATIDRSGRYSVPLDTTGLEGVVATPKQAELTVEVAPRVTRVLSDVAVGFSRASGLDGLEAIPDSVDVVVQGVAARVESVEAEDLRVEVLIGDVGWVAPGAERRAAARVVGLPDLVEGSVVQDSILVRRAPGGAGR